MATTGAVNDSQPRSVASDLRETEIKPAQFARLGLLNGLLLGTAVAIGVWGLQVYAFRALPVAQKYASILVAGTAVILMCSLVGWLTARLRNTLLSIALWLITAVVITFITTYQPYHIQTFTAWLADTRFWGMSIFPFHSAFTTQVLLGILVAGFFLTMLFALLALFQDSRLVGINQERGANGRLNHLAWQKLLLPLPLVILVGYVTANIMGNESWRSLPVINQVILTVRSYDGDLFALGLEEGINYAAARGVRDQLDGDYLLSTSTVDPLSLTTFVVADFANGAWINCRFVNNQLTYCYDASPPYTVGLSSLITGKPVPDECRGCVPETAESLHDWLSAQKAQFAGEPIISRTGQQGDHVIMRAEAADGRFAIDCWFSGSSPVALLRCEEVN